MFIVDGVCVDYIDFDVCEMVEYFIEVVLVCGIVIECYYFDVIVL